MSQLINASERQVANTTGHRIRSVSIIGGFLDGARIDFIDGLNCLIGPRGAGKTTVVELMRFALDLVPSRESNLAERRRIESLVEKNLAGGRVQVTIETREGLSYVVSRHAGEEPMVLLPDETPTEITLKSGGVFRADVYSQNEVESIADRTSSQLELIDNFEIERIKEIELQLRQVRSELSANANQIVPVQTKIAAIAEEVGMLAGLDERLKTFVVTGGEDAAAINQAHTVKALRDREQRLGIVAEKVLREFGKELAALNGRLGQHLVRLADREISDGPNGAIVRETLTQLDDCGDVVDRLLGDAGRRIAEAVERVAATHGRLSLVHKEQELAFRALIERHQQAQGQAAERAQLERRRNDLLAKKRLGQQLEEQLKAAQENRANLLARLKTLLHERFAIRRSVVDRINANLSPMLRVEVTQFGNPKRYQRLLEEGLKNARTKPQMVAQKLVEAFWPVDLVAVLRRRDAAALVDRGHLNPEQADKVIAALGDSPLLFELETVELLDLSRIELKDGDEYKDSRTLSTGQKCTAILPILLLDSANPLIVDQPEDNLDNRFISEAVAHSIRQAKSNRQMVFVTHNPNIPILGDADRVCVLDSNGKLSRKVAEGTIDQVKPHVVNLLEGGERAFKTRRERYAY